MDREFMETIRLNIIEDKMDKILIKAQEIKKQLQKFGDKIDEQERKINEIYFKLDNWAIEMNKL